MERKEYWNEQHAHDCNDDTERRAYLHEIAETVLSGPTTSVFTGEEIGVMNAVDAASATIIANG